LPFSRIRYLQKSATELSREEEPGIGGNYWVLGRELCVYKSLDLSGIAKGERNMALAIQLRQISPFASPGYFVVFHGNIAQIWLWDAAAQKQSALAAKTRQARPLPEALLQNKPTSNGLFLRPCLTGHELQYWQDDSLLLSKWWPYRPTVEEIHLFATANDLPESKAEFFPKGAWLTKPWANTERIGSPGFAHLEQGLLLALFCTAAFFFTYYASQGLQLHWHLQKIEKEQQELEGSIQPVLDARAAVASDAETIKIIANLNPGPSLTIAFAEALQLLQPNDLHLVGWQYQHPALLLHLRGARQTETSALVRLFEENKFFSGVSFAEDAKNKTMILTMTPVRPPAEQREHDAANP